VLAIALAYNKLKLCERTSIFMISGMVDIGPIWRALGSEKSEALPVFHAFTGADNNGKFSGRFKTERFNQYMEVDINLSRAMMNLPEDGDLKLNVKDQLEHFICTMYCPKDAYINSIYIYIPNLRWHLFCKQLTESNKLTVTLGALEECIKGRWSQSGVWCQATVMNQQP